MLKITNPENFRENIRNKLLPILEDTTLAINLEKGVYNYAIQEATFHKIVKKWENPHFAQLYIDRMRSIYINLKNTELLQQIKNNEILPQTLAFMTHQEFNPKQWKECIDRKIKRDISKYTTTIEASTDIFVCPKCKSKKCTYYEMQTRSADEPSTIFVTCLDCGKCFKR
jgi:transcription elongation factor S-II